MKETGGRGIRGYGGAVHVYEREGAIFTLSTSRARRRKKGDERATNGTYWKGMRIGSNEDDKKRIPIQ